jgi:DNA-binding response OmpR family regulator
MPASGPMVLVVEDDPMIGQVLVQLLDISGYTVELAEDGVAGLACIERGGVDLVILDLMLPEIDGLEVCRRLRTSEQGVYLPIIMLTALGSAEQRHAGFAAGADDYIVKPFDTDDLLDRVAVWVQVRQRLAAAHERLLAEQARARALAERLARDEAIATMARTTSDQLNDPLTVLLGLLELRREGSAVALDDGALWNRLERAAEELAARSRALGHAVRYETHDVAGIRFLDLSRAQRLDPPPSISVRG